MSYPIFTEEKIRNIFTYHPPTAEDARKYAEINEAFIQLGLIVIPLLPDGAGKTAAIRQLAQSRMACNAAVALNGDF